MRHSFSEGDKSPTNTYVMIDSQAQYLPINKKWKNRYWTLAVDIDDIAMWQVSVNKMIALAGQNDSLGYGDRDLRQQWLR